MAPAERLRQLPGYFAFNAGVMFFIGLASALMSAGTGAEPEHLRLIGFAVLLAVLAMAAGFASVARIEFAKREGKAFAIAWILPAVLIGLPLGRDVASGAVEAATYAVSGAGVVLALAGMAWLALKARQEVRA